VSYLKYNYFDSPTCISPINCGRQNEIVLLLITFISEAHKLHPPYTCTAPPEYVVVTKEVEVNG
jgi:hypothetical protein